MHRRNSSLSVPNLEGLQPASSGDMSGIVRPIAAAPSPMVDPDVFPPVRSRVPDPSTFMPYIPEDIAFEEEYEEYLSDLGSHDTSGVNDPYGSRTGTSAWDRLATIGPEIADGISDSESIGSIADLTDELRGDSGERETPDENRNSWEVSLVLHEASWAMLTTDAAHEPQDDGNAAQVTSRAGTKVKLGD